MAKKISNTLTRWHKVADRIKQAASQVRAANQQALQMSRGIDADTFAVRKTSLAEGARKALGDQTQLYLKLQDGLFAVRRALAHANTQHGVSDLLNQMEQSKQTGDYYDGLIETTAVALTEAEFVALAAKRASRAQSDRDMYGVTATFVSAEQLADLVAKRDASRRETNALADRLSDANATKISLEIDDAVAEALGL